MQEPRATRPPPCGCLRVPTRAPFRLQFCFNGRDWLARRLEERRTRFAVLDNAFIALSNFDTAQRIADRCDVKRLHSKLETYTW